MITVTGVRATQTVRGIDRVKSTEQSAFKLLVEHDNVWCGYLICTLITFHLRICRNREPGRGPVLESLQESQLSTAQELRSARGQKETRLGAGAAIRERHGCLLLGGALDHSALLGVVFIF